MRRSIMFPPSHQRLILSLVLQVVVHHRPYVRHWWNKNLSYFTILVRVSHPSVLVVVVGDVMSYGLIVPRQTYLQTTFDGGRLETWFFLGKTHTSLKYHCSSYIETRSDSNFVIYINSSQALEVYYPTQAGKSK